MVYISDLKANKKLDYINSIWLAIMEMNSHMLKGLLCDDVDYEDIGKEKFIEKLNDTFTYHVAIGDDEFFLDLDYCNGCQCNQPVCKFIGNLSGEHFALIFDIHEEEIIDIYHCNSYGNKNLLDELY